MALPAQSLVGEAKPLLRVSRQGIRILRGKLGKIGSIRFSDGPMNLVILAGVLCNRWAKTARWDVGRRAMETQSETGK